MSAGKVPFRVAKPDKTPYKAFAINRTDNFWNKTHKKPVLSEGLMELMTMMFQLKPV